MQDLIIVESPYWANTEIGRLFNTIYARACNSKVLAEGNIPFSSHIYYTQPGILDDQVNEDREKGMRAGFSIGEKFDYSIFFTDYGLSSGMKAGAESARLNGNHSREDKLSENWLEQYLEKALRHSDARIWGLVPEFINPLKEYALTKKREQKYLLMTLNA